MPELTISGPRGPLPVHVVLPDTTGPWPGVVVIHDAVGMSQDVRRQADWLARAGFVAAAPDLFSWGGTLRCMRQAIREARAGSGRSFDEIEAVRTWLRGRPDCTGRIGVVGFCLGGGFALLLAPRGAFDAASVNYGAAGKAAYTERFLAGSCPIVGSFGAKDLSLRGACGTRPPSRPAQPGGVRVDGASGRVAAVTASFVAPILRVADADAAVRWYRRLGFTEEWRHRFEPGLPWYVGMSRGETAQLHLSEHAGDARPGTLVYLSVPDVDDLAVACGVTRIDEMPWGRDFEVQDLDGNRIRVGTPTA